MYWAETVTITPDVASDMLARKKAREEEVGR